MGGAGISSAYMYQSTYCKSIERLGALTDLSDFREVRDKGGCGYNITSLWFKMLHLVNQEHGLHTDHQDDIFLCILRAHKFNDCS